MCKKKSDCLWNIIFVETKSLWGTTIVNNQFAIFFLPSLSCLYSFLFCSFLEANTQVTFSPAFKSVRVLPSNSQSIQKTKLVRVVLQIRRHFTLKRLLSTSWIPLLFFFWQMLKCTIYFFFNCVVFETVDNSLSVKCHLTT